MSDSVTMPALGESVTEGTVTRWLKQVGDTVAVDEPLVEISTDKVDTEIPSPFGGVLEQILVAEDETVAVGAPLAIIGTGASAEASPTTPEPAAEPAAPVEAAPAPVFEPEIYVPRLEEPAVDVPTSVAAHAYASPGSAEAAPAVEPPAVEPPAVEPPAAETPAAETPAAETPAAETPAAETPAAETPAAETPAVETDAVGPSERVVMPALGESVTEGIVTRWLKQVGESVALDEPLLEISTDKVDTEIPSPIAGVLQEILVAEDETVPVGAALAVIRTGAPISTSVPAPMAPPSAEVSVEVPADVEPTPEAAVSPTAVSPALISPAAVSPAEAAPEEPPASTPAHAPSHAAPETTEAPAPPEPVSVGAAANATTGYLTPLVRKLANDSGVDLTAVVGTGVGGRIRKEDVLEAAARAAEAAAEAKAAEATASASTVTPPRPVEPPVVRTPTDVSPLRGTTEKMSRLRTIVAQRMVESLKQGAQLTTVVEVDVTKVARLRAKTKEAFETREGARLTFLPFFAMAAVEALKSHPKVNASIDGDQVIYHGEENLGIAVDTDRGLLVPVIRDAGALNLAGIARKIQDVAARTRANKVGPDELAGATFTITNTGSGGALFDTPIVPLPQVAIMATGAIVKRPVVISDVDGGETIAIRSMCYLSLSYDHRLVDGADAARYLSAVKARIEEGAFESEVGL
jgi:pyruvate dehydrogenase E2 component (dihydrolipoamide acetyltransferase)